MAWSTVGYTLGGFFIMGAVLIGGNGFGIVVGSFFCLMGYLAAKDEKKEAEGSVA